MNRATVNKIFQKHPVYVKAGMNRGHFDYYFRMCI